MDRLRQWLGLSRETQNVKPSADTPPETRKVTMATTNATQPTPTHLATPPTSRSRSKSPKRHRDRQHSGHEKYVEKSTSDKGARSVTKPADEQPCFPQEHQNPEVQESDGNFFESFTALAWRQENKRLRLASVDEKNAEKPTASELQFAAKTKTHQLSKKEFELLYIEVLYTIKHKIGTTASSHSPFIQDLYQYAQEGFGVSPEDHARLLAKATEEKPPIVVLNVRVVDAKGLLAKDADGFSDPYCMLGIMPGRPPDLDQNAMFSSDEESNKKDKDKKDKDKKDRGLRRLSTSLRRSKRDKNYAVKELLPARLIRTTSVKPNTLNPEWNEKFRFDLQDVNTDHFHLDIWDHDDESSVFDAAKKLNEVTGLKGLGRFFKQIAQSARSKNDDSVDDFLGCVDISVQDIPSVGLDQYYTLQGRSSRSNIQGEIHLILSLATREDRGIPEDDNWTDIQQHQDLMSIFIDYELRIFNDSSYLWNGVLPQAAQTIMHQHAIQGDITEEQQAVCRWMAYSQKHTERQLNYDILLALLNNLNKTWKSASLSSEEEECLAESFLTFIDYCMNLIRRVREIFPPSNRKSIKWLEGMLRCLAKIYDMQAFKKCCPFEKELHLEITAIIKKGTQEWYERIFSLCSSHSKQDDEGLSMLIKLTNHLNADMSRSQQFYQELFVNIVGVDYFCLVYKQSEKMLSADASKALEEELGDEMKEDINKILKLTDCDRDEDTAASTMGTALFELYLALQEFAKYGDRLPTDDQMNLSITKSYEWFAFAVSRWINIARRKAEHRIRKAVELDRVVQVDDMIKYSSSAVDACFIFAQMTEFWKQLSWPDKAGSYPFVLRLVQDISMGAKLYANLVHNKLAAAGYYDDEGQFDVTEQLCITVNNIEHVRRALLPLPVQLEFQAIQQAYARSNGNRNSQKDHASLMDTLKEANDSIVEKLTQVVNRVALKMRPVIKKDVFHLNWAPESLPANQALDDLLAYLDNNLLTLNKNLLKTNFERILLSIWIQVLDEFQAVILNEEVRPPVIYQRMFDALALLVDFFHASGKGLAMDDILIAQYQGLREQLTFHMLDTCAIIEKFYTQLVEKQKLHDSCDYGILRLRAMYRYDSHTLTVQVLSAKDIIPLDANGLSDPFVLVQLAPDHLFPNVLVQSTKIVKKTLNPVFDEIFEFTVTPDQCQHEGATVQFTVMDHDVVFQNDFAGEVFLAMADVPGVDGREISKFDALNTINLPLLQLKQKSHSALDILSRRTWDKDAQDFVKKRIKVEEQAISSNP
ncbi:BAI1-associated protein 3-like [Gigantopelta aegis]|uniref:BAI1-associated protein 3-like n=1 Tax=Gigantopelta aegis TaxID=1735272 RepID=UPI001B88D38C|nr:BAI1-associated protein 3-like [Gigantopelta aegis]